MARPYEDWLCNKCGLSNAEREGVEQCYSFGYFAGYYHDTKKGDCWERSGYRDAVHDGDSDEQFDPYYAGESLHGEDDWF